MTDSPDLDPAGVPQSAPARPETVPLDAAAPGPRPLPSPVGTPAPTPGVPDRLPADGTTLTLQTTLFGQLAVPNGAARAAEIEELSRRAAVYATRARGDGTRRAYRAAWRQFEAWCRTLGREPLAADPDTIAMYVVRCADQGLRRQLDPGASRGDPHRAPARRAVARPAPPPPRHGGGRSHPL
jgi:hypothetical protein